MANDDHSMGSFGDLWRNQEEERRLNMEEFRFRYEDRKRRKAENRSIVEGAALKICAAVEKMLADGAEQIETEKLTELAAALNRAAAAMQEIEMYSEYVPYGGGFCAV